MAKTFPEISPELKKWIAKQPVYFIASAPLQADGHINLSPRGLDTLRVTGKKEVLILDLTGSGNETAAHLAENGRLTIMMCAFEGEPRILRLYGSGEVIRDDNQNWLSCRARFADDIPGVRQIFRLHIQRIQTSCGFGVPLMQFEKQRDMLTNWAQKKTSASLREYQLKNNARSIDGLAAPGLED